MSGTATPANVGSMEGLGVTRRLPPSENKFHVGNGDDGKHYWLTPPDLFADLHARYSFTFDPCPYPKPPEFDGLTCEWGASNYVNPPFGSVMHQGKKKGPTAWARKAIAEAKKGKRVVLVYPIDKWVLMLLAAGATVRNLGDVRWLATEDGSAGKGTGRHIAEFVLEPPATPDEPPRTGEMFKCRDGRAMTFKEIGPAGMLLCEDASGCEQLLFPHDVVAVTPNGLGGEPPGLTGRLPPSWLNERGTMTGREVNEKISEWIGRPCTCSYGDGHGHSQGCESRYWGDCAMHHLGGLPTPYATSDRCAVELMSELTQRGYKTILESCSSHHNLGGGVGYLFQISKEKWKYSCLQPTISEAICQATVKLIESI